MQTAQLIEQLSADVAPVRPQSPARALAPGLASGAALALIAVLAIYGVQPGLDTFDHGAPFAMKLAYVGIDGAIGMALAASLSRPGEPAVGIRWLWLPIAAMAALAAWQFADVPTEDWPALMLGGSWTKCPWRILGLSLPVLAGLTIVVRGQAPTDLRRAGAAIGLASGATAASVYALACTENSAAFVLIWYSLGIALSTALGALVGARLLRW